MALLRAIAVILLVPVTTVLAETPAVAKIVLVAATAAVNDKKWACLYRQAPFSPLRIYSFYYPYYI
jgi:hypothetical protein